MERITPKITILEIRARNKLTQAQFAESIGVTPQTVGAWERDINTISPKNLIKVCRTYGVKSIDLLGA